MGRVDDHKRTCEANFQGEFNGLQNMQEQPKQCPRTHYCIQYSNRPYLQKKSQKKNSMSEPIVEPAKWQHSSNTFIAWGCTWFGACWCTLLCPCWCTENHLCWCIRCYPGWCTWLCICNFLGLVLVKNQDTCCGTMTGANLVCQLPCNKVKN